jgi:hypothetical protein
MLIPARKKLGPPAFDCTFDMPTALYANAIALNGTTFFVKVQNFNEKMSKFKS